MSFSQLSGGLQYIFVYCFIWYLCSN